MIGRRRVGRSSRGLQCAGERIGSGVESVLIFFSVNDRQHGPAIRIIWQLLNSSLQADPGGGMLIGGEALVIAEAAQDRLVGAELFGGLASERLAHAMSHTSVVIGNGLN